MLIFNGQVLRAFMAMVQTLMKPTLLIHEAPTRGQNTYSNGTLLITKRMFGVRDLGTSMSMVQTNSTKAPRPARIISLLFKLNPLAL
jgi:hypothetical protein